MLKLRISDNMGYTSIWLTWNFIFLVGGPTPPSPSAATRTGTILNPRNNMAHFYGR